MKLKSLVAAAALTAMGSLALAGSHQSNVKVGMITTLSGGGAGLGIDVRDGFLLAAMPTRQALKTRSFWRRTTQRAQMR